jgi:hypothetical protein
MDVKIPALWVKTSAISRRNTTTSVWMASPHTQHDNKQLSTCNFVSILYFNIDFKLLFKTKLGQTEN